MSRRPPLGRLVEIAQTLVLTLVIFLLIQTFVAQPFKVEGRSMEHTLEPDQYVLIDKLTPRFDTYERGDIVVFAPPPDWSQLHETPFIKRVIGEAGDTVEIRDGEVLVNGIKLVEPYIYAEAPGDLPQPTNVSSDTGRWVIPSDELFVMGDHRSDSVDSRAFGPIAIDKVVGRAWLRYWPFDTFGILQATEASVTPAPSQGISSNPDVPPSQPTLRDAVDGFEIGVTVASSTRVGV
jgi:signal peptidase I